MANPLFCRAVLVLIVFSAVRVTLVKDEKSKYVEKQPYSTYNQDELRIRNLLWLKESLYCIEENC